MGHDLSLDTQLISLSHNPLRAENSARTFFMRALVGGGSKPPPYGGFDTSSVICEANATFPKGKALMARRVVAVLREGRK